MAALLAVYAALALHSLRQKSVTTDEITYLTAGYVHWTTGDFSFNATNPPLMKMIAALPLLALDLELPPHQGEFGSWNEVEQWQYARAFLYGNRSDADRMLFWARVPGVVVGALLGLLVFAWARELYGPRAGLGALFLYALAPNILAHARLATLDLGLTASFFAAAYAFWRFARAPGLGPLVLGGVALGAAILTKTTALFLLPILALYAAALVVLHPGRGAWPGLLRRVRCPTEGRLAQAVSLAAGLAGMGGVALLALNAGYGFSGTLQPISSDESHPGAYRRLPWDSALTRALVDWAAETPLPVPKPFTDMLRFQARRTEGGNHVYFHGRTSRGGWWSMTLAAAAIKTPLALFGLVGLALVGALAARRLSDAEILALLSVGFVMAIFTALKQNAVGLRYVLPIFPFLHLLAARVWRSGAAVRPTWARVGLAALVLWYASAAARIHPHYLAYFNELVGGPRHGYRWLADSYLDWGQDLKGLKKYLEEHDIQRIRLAYFGSADARYYGIDYEYLPSVGLAPRRPGERWWYEVRPEELPPLELAGGPMAVSATLLAGIFYPGYYAPLRALEPVDQVGYSILIFDPDRPGSPAGTPRAPAPAAEAEP